MQRRSIYSSLLLVSLLSTFSFATSFAQNAVNVESKSSPRCVTNTVNVSVDISQDVSGLEIVLDWSGDGTVTNVTFDAGLANLAMRGADWTSNPGQIRLYALDNTGGTDCLASGTGIAVATIEYTTDDVCSGSLDFVGGTFNCPTTPVTASSQFVDCATGALVAATVNAGAVSVDNATPVITCPSDVTMHWGTSSFPVASATDSDEPNGCENLTYSLGAAPSYASIDAASGVITLSPLGGDVCEASVEVIVTDKCGATDNCTFNVCVQNTPPVFASPAADTTLLGVWGEPFFTTTVSATDADSGPVGLSYSIINFEPQAGQNPTILPTIDGNTGVLTWNFEHTPHYIGLFKVTVEVTDGAATCIPCSPNNADTLSFFIHLKGFRVSIEKVHNQLQGQTADVSVFIDSNWVDGTPYETDALGGFDFLIQYDPSAMSSLGATAGEMISNGSSSDWEYFTYRFGPNGNCGSGCPTGKIRIVGIRDMNDGMHHPTDKRGPGELFQLHFMVSNDRTFECQFAPIQFCWYDCGDNTMSDLTGDSLYISCDVFTFEGVQMTGQDQSFPTLTGAPNSCMADSGGQNGTKIDLFRVTEFRNGGIDIICADSIDARGDVNLNGLSNEIADAVVFTNYFVQGLNAFNVNADGQTAATEINGDGVPLTVADLVYLIRVIVGDALPLPKLVHGQSVQFSNRGGVISSDVELGAALFVFNGIADVRLEASGMDIKTGIVDGNTHALVYSLEGNTIAAGSVVSSDGELLSIEASDINGALLSPGDMIVRPTEFAVYQNYPNPFNPSTKIRFDMAEAGQYTVSIYNVAGQKVKEFNGNAGNETVELEWDASTVASGMYFYKVSMNGFSATKKMVLLK